MKLKMQKNCDQGVRNEKEKNADVHSFGKNETDSVHSLSGNHTYRDSMFIVQTPRSEASCECET